MPPTIDSSITWRKQKQGFTFPFDKLYEENKQIIHSRVANSEVLNEMIDVEPVIGALKGHSIERSLILAQFAIATFSEIHDCRL